MVRDDAEIAHQSLERVVAVEAARGTDERATGAVLLVAGLLAHQHDARVRRTFTEDGLRGAFVELARGTRRGALA